MSVRTLFSGRRGECGSTRTGSAGPDAFVFTVGNSTGDSISTTINLGSDFQLTNFQERLYKYTGAAPTIGSFSGALDFWTIPSGDSGTVAVLPSTFLAAGTYVLEVRGEVTGSAGGAYAAFAGPPPRCRVAPPLGYRRPPDGRPRPFLGTASYRSRPSIRLADRGVFDSPRRTARGRLLDASLINGLAPSRGFSTPAGPRSRLS